VTRNESRNMSAPDSKPKVEGRRTFRRPNNAMTKKKEYMSTNTGVETFTFLVGNPKYAAKYQQHLEALALHIQEKYQNGSSIAKSIRDMKLVVIKLDEYPQAEDGSGGGPPNAKQVHLWQQIVNVQVKEQRTHAENIKKAYDLIMGQCSPTLVSKIKRDPTNMRMHQTPWTW
jgi:hypothetical protein